MDKRSTPLTARVEGDELVIRVGVDQLAHAIISADAFHGFSVEADAYVRDFAISGPMGFAKDVVRAMQKESEDGSTPLTRFLDEVAGTAMDDGARGIKYDVEVKHGDIHACERWAVAP